MAARVTDGSGAAVLLDQRPGPLGARVLPEPSPERAGTFARRPGEQRLDPPGDLAGIAVVGCEGVADAGAAQVLGGNELVRGHRPRQHRQTVTERLHDRVVPAMADDR